MINIMVNNKAYTIAKDSSLQEVLKTVTNSLNGIAVAVNETIIPKTDWTSQVLQAQDNILIIEATQGG